MQQKEISLDSSSSLIWAPIIMATSCEFMAVHPQHSSFYPKTSRSSSRGSPFSSPTFPVSNSPISLHLHSFPLHGPSPRQVLLGSHAHTLLCQGRFAALEPRVLPMCPPMLFPMLKKSLEETFGSNPCRHEHILLANFSRHPPAERAPELWQWIRTGR